MKRALCCVCTLLLCSSAALAAGGETCDTATLIPPLVPGSPFSDSGVLGATDDCLGRPYRDVFYRYDCTCSGSYTFDMCGTNSGDSYMTLRSVTCCTGTLIASGDDQCATSAPSITTNLVAGTTYYLECGYYFSTTAAGPYVFHASTTCGAPTGACCALDGTCTETPQANCTGTWLGAGTTCTPNPCPQPGACCFPDGHCTSLPEPTCGTQGGVFLGPGTTCTQNPCPQPPVPCCLATGCVMMLAVDCTAQGGTPGVYGFDCANWFCTPPDTCEAALPMPVPGHVGFRIDNLTDDPTPACGVVTDPNKPHKNGWVTVYGTGDTITLTTCSTATTVSDTVMKVFCDCPAVTCVAGNDDSNCPNGGLKSTLSFCSFPGVPYYVTVGSYGATATGVIDLIATDDGVPCPIQACAPLPGACCLPGGACVPDLTQVACSEQGGVWQGAGTTCVPNPCPQPPVNDDCPGAIAVTEGTPAATGDNCLTLLPDWAEASCQANSNRDLWYAYTASCTGLVVMDTEGSAQSDTVLSVYASCSGPEIACDDDSGTGFLSRLTFSATAGTTYYVRVASYSTGCGGFNLNIACDPYGACCVGSACTPNLTAAACTTQAGIWQGPGTDCFPNPCVPIDYWWDVTTGEQGGNGWNGQWIFYPNAPTGPWYNMWWPNEFDPLRHKRITLTFRADFPIGSGVLESAFVWATPDWQNPDRPPLAEEETFIQRQLIEPITLPGAYTYTLELPFCPAWVSIDVRGNGYLIEGTIQHICLAPELGACCFPDGSCQDLPAAQCLPPAIWHAGTDCATFQCPQPPTGACCFRNCNCVELTPEECLAQGGRFKGIGTPCEPHLCVCRGDTNCDGVVNFGDINPFVAALTHPEDTCCFDNCDVNGDGAINFADINPFVAVLTVGGPCP